MQQFSYKKIDLKMLWDGGHFVPAFGVLICAYWQKTGNLGLNGFFISKDSFEDGDF